MSSCKRWTRYMVKFIRKPLYVKRMLIRAFFLSAWYRWRLIHRPFAELSPKIGKLGYETAAEVIESPMIREVGWAVLAACRHTPWESLCLVQALTAKKLLNGYGFRCTLYMGVCKSKEGELLAHAWLRCGQIIVTGRQGASRYTVTTIYGDEE